jgi:ABC-2 type transport system permease protein
MAQDVLNPVPAVDEDPLTPREGRIRRAAMILRWGAIFNGTAALLALLGIVLVTTGVVPGLRPVLAGLLSRFDGAEDVALLVTILLLLGNVSALLVTMISLLAQEVWSLILLVLVLAANATLLVWQGFAPGLLSIGAALLAGGIVFRDVRAFRQNPVMLKELRERMRGARAFVVISVYLGLMSVFAVLLYLIQRGVVLSAGSAVTGELGRVLFAGVVGVELLLIIFIAPAFTAGVVANERERKTYDLLQITLLPRPSFVVGKLEAALSYIFLLLLAAIPLQSIAFLFGGVSETELILAFIILGVTAIALGTVGLYFSTTVDRTLMASVRAYSVAFAVTIGVPLLLGFFIGIFNGAVVGTGNNLTSSPVLEAILIYFGALVVSLNPIATALSTQQLLIDQQAIGFWTATLSSDGSSIPMVSPWISFTIVYLMIATVLVVLAVRRMRRMEE